MIKIGVTGNIGSGKSVVCELLKIHGIPVYNADKEAKRLNNSSPVIREKLIHHFGKEIYIEETRQKQVCSNHFSMIEKLSLANSIIHPEVAKTLLHGQHQNNYPIVALKPLYFSKEIFTTMSIKPLRFTHHTNSRSPELRNETTCR